MNTQHRDVTVHYSVRHCYNAQVWADLSTAGQPHGRTDGRTDEPKATHTEAHTRGRFTALVSCNAYARDHTLLRRLLPVSGLKPPTRTSRN